MVTGEFFEDEGKISETVFWSFDTAAAHAESLRRDDTIDLLCDTFCGRIKQKGQTNGFDVRCRNLWDLIVLSRKARPPTLIVSMCHELIAFGG